MSYVIPFVMVNLRVGDLEAFGGFDMVGSCAWLVNPPVESLTGGEKWYWLPKWTEYHEREILAFAEVVE